MRHDVTDLYTFPDDHTHDAIHHAIKTLGNLRGFCDLIDDPRDFLDDPALRLHLLVSLQQQLTADILHALLDAHDHGYTLTELAVLLDHPL